MSSGNTAAERRELAALVRPALPLIASQVGMMVLGVVETLIVGRAGTSALGAVSLGILESTKPGLHGILLRGAPMRRLVAMAMPGFARHRRNAGRFGNPPRVSMSTVLVLVMGVVRPGWAANICNETVPGNRIIDGVPAYQQCTDSNSAGIYSNNGVDTATGSGGSDWVRTQSNGGYQCTELAHRYLYFKWGVRSVPNGNAGVWCDGTIPSGLEKTTNPMHGDLIVFAPGSCGADQTTGHVAVVDVVNANATVTFIEQNRAGRRSCAANTAACFLHATANIGAMVDGGTADGPAPDSASVAEPEVSVRPDRPSDRQRADVPGSGGTVTTGGSVGSGGAPGTGGTSGGPTGGGGITTAGGAPGSGGQAGTGGATTVASAGGSGGATSSTGEPTVTSNNGCSCRLGDGRSAELGAGVAFLLMLGGTLARLRRRRC